MARTKNIFQITQRSPRLFTWGDVFTLILTAQGNLCHKGAVFALYLLAFKHTA
ncbi:MAG: hypothetical protein K0B14_10770 [Anaerolineaceae bacterium]|nr:hypothetical protein [Anaerolineaceae bacterium]